MAATLPLSRSNPYHATTSANEFGLNDDQYDEWGPNSVPPTSASNVPWDEQVVPALRKKLEKESQKLGRRISAIEASDSGWSASAVRSRESIERRDPRSSLAQTALLHEGQAVEVSLGNDTEAQSIRQDERSFRYAAKGLAAGEAGDARANSAGRHSTVSSRTRVQSSGSSVLPSNGSLSRSPSQMRDAGSRDEATARARERARQIARERAESTRNSSIAHRESSTSSHTPRPYKGRDETLLHRAERQGAALRQQPDVFPRQDGRAGAGQDESMSESWRPGSSFEQQRLRTQSTPMKYVKTSDASARGADGSRRSGGTSEAAYPSTPQHDADDGAQGKAEALQASYDHQPSRTFPSHQRQPLGRVDRNTPPQSDLLDEFGPLGGVPRSDRNKSTPTRSASKRSGLNAQPDAFRSLSPHRYAIGPDVGDGARGHLAAPDEFGAIGSMPTMLDTRPTSTHAWDEEIIPTVARKLQQQMLMAGDPRLSRVDGLIDTWDRDGLPLSKSEVARRIQQAQEAASQQANSDRERHGRLHEPMEERETAAERADRQELPPGDDGLKLNLRGEQGGESLEPPQQEVYAMQTLRQSTQDERRSRSSHGGRSLAEGDAPSAYHADFLQQQQQQQERPRQQQQQEHRQQQYQQQQQAAVHSLSAVDRPHGHAPAQQTESANELQQASGRQQPKPAQKDDEADAGCCKCTIM